MVMGLVSAGAGATAGCSGAFLPGAGAAAWFGASAEPALSGLVWVTDGPAGFAGPAVPEVCGPAAPAVLPVGLAAPAEVGDGIATG
jgi:hypothetical protein